MDSEVRVFHTDIGYFCNNNCFYCYEQKDEFGMVRKEYKPINQIEKEFYEAIQQGYNRVCLVGAEPTLRPDFIDVINWQRELDLELRK